MGNSDCGIRRKTSFKIAHFFEGHLLSLANSQTNREPPTKGEPLPLYNNVCLEKCFMSSHVRFPGPRDWGPSDRVDIDDSGRQ